MLEKFKAYVQDKELFTPNDKVILAVSGGIDSVVMCHLFHQANFPFAIAHCNFGLRGEESDEDELFVKKLAKKYKAPFYSDHFEAAAFAEKEKISIQMAARTLRYEWFNRLAESEGYAYIATAHHLNDSVETLLLNITRGTGIAGLHGIQPKVNRLIRPLLFADKEEIHAYVVENQLAWREDSSNQSIKYQRNLIRHEVIPLLKKINPSLESTMEQTIERLTAVEHIFQAEVERVRQQVIRKQGDVEYLDFTFLQQETEPLIKLYELIKETHFSYTQAQDIWQVLEAEPGRRFESPTHTLVKDRTELIITPKQVQQFISATITENQDFFSNESLELRFQEVSAKNFSIPTDANIACLDKQLIQFPLKLRQWKQGDWFCPLGMNKKKKLSDFLIDVKIPLNLKSKIWVLTSNGSIVWIIGQRIDNRFKITEKTEHILQITARIS
ncbi:tRNA lysidine(34) synthetase TilS [Rhodocytophaga aerolata]|uniref:tRNA(Ile)-lysidine synthase n=1 Tax=Rhodocytophaga aerolata TaxID=455078 RepID=A0ABT8R330_9BACT|nr:tRNA lysidine(34) synthetase TilS [Rhodocytophaga aerolata]MDO1445688.1 tRNA lysidine(34) synthetase TilS [Rhodocytophaga aerolata]